VLAALALAGPVAVYFWSEFFSRMPGGWFDFVPLLGVWRVAEEGAGWRAVGWTAGTYAAVGLVISLSGRLHRRRFQL
jgi:hypothetical protein